MRLVRYCLVAVVVALVGPTQARAQVGVVFGSSWDGPSASLQGIIDARYGAGLINVTTDYLGASASDPDPFYWIGDEFSAYLIREIAGNAALNVVGWYEETGATPIIDGVNDGIVFNGSDSEGRSAVVSFEQPGYRFGFYMDPAGSPHARNTHEDELFFSSRIHNDQGPDGSGAIHSPAGGDVQALVFDVSRWSEPNTWLVCFEDVDSGAMPGPQDSADTDNDFNDFVMEIRALGATPVATTSFGSLKRQYR